MHEVRSGNVRNDAQVHPQRLYGGVRPAQVLGHRVGRHSRSVVVGFPGRAEGTHLQIHMLGQHPAELGNVDAGAAIDFGREFFGHNVYSHKPQGSRYG